MRVRRDDPIWIAAAVLPVVSHEDDPGGDHRATGEEHQCPADRPVTDRGQHDPECDPSGKEQVVEALL